MKNLFEVFVTATIFLASAIPTFADDYTDARKLIDKGDNVGGIVLMKKAAESGNVDAMVIVGGFYELGVDGIKQDYSEAFKYFKKAADTGNPYAQWVVGNYYLYGLGMSVDFSQALIWYQKAAEQDYVRGLAAVGHMYFQGQGVPKNIEKAKELYLRAAEYGAEGVMNNLAVLTTDSVERYKWSLLAEAMNSNRAYIRAYMENRESFEKELTPSEIEKGRLLAEEWIKNHPKVKIGKIHNKNKTIQPQKQRKLPPFP